MHTVMPRLFFFAIMLAAWSSFAAETVTVLTVEAEPGDTSVRVDICTANEADLLEYFNLLVFDETRLTFVDLVADRGGFWYGYYPTLIDGDHVYVHGWSDTYPDCIDPAVGDPGPPLYHLVFDVQPGAPAGLAWVVFDIEGPFDGHWNDCSGYSVSPAPVYHAGGVLVEDSTGIGESHQDAITAWAHPNPAAGGTRISFVLPEAAGADVSVYDLTGRRIRTVATGVTGTGVLGVHWDGLDDQGRPAPGGVYFCRVRSATDIAVRKVMLIR